MTSKQEQDTLDENKTPELQRELEEVYSPVSSVRKMRCQWCYRFLRVIGRYFGLE